jgi:hypothetical protein
MVKKKVESSDKKEVILVGSYNRIFKSPDGKAVLHDLMNKFKMLNAGFNSDVSKMVYGEGQRSVILYILSQKDTNPEALEKIMEELSAE